MSLDWLTSPMHRKLLTIGVINFAWHFTALILLIIDIFSLQFGGSVRNHNNFPDGPAHFANFTFPFQSLPVGKFSGKPIKCCCMKMEKFFASRQSLSLVWVQPSNFNTRKTIRWLAVAKKWRKIWWKAWKCCKKAHRKSFEIVSSWISVLIKCIECQMMKISEWNIGKTHRFSLRNEERIFFLLSPFSSAESLFFHSLLLLVVLCEGRKIEISFFVLLEWMDFVWLNSMCVCFPSSSSAAFIEHSWREFSDN